MKGVECSEKGKGEYCLKETIKRKGRMLREILLKKMSERR